MFSNILIANKVFCAIFLLLLGIIFVDLYGVIIKYLGDVYPMMQMTLFRNIFAVIPLIILVYFSGELKDIFNDINKKIILLSFFRGISFLVMQCFYFIAIIKMNFATATTLSFCSPIFIVLLSIIILGDKIGIYRWFAVFVGFFGVLLIMKPTSEVFTIYSLFPLIAAFAWAIANVLLKLFPENISAAKINLYTLIFSFLGSLIIFILTTEYESIVNINHWLLLILTGILGGCASIFFIFAYRLMVPSILAPFEYFGIPSSFILGWIFFSEAPIDQLFPGVLGIIIAGLIIIWREKKQSLVEEKYKKLNQP